MKEKDEGIGEREGRRKGWIIHDGIEIKVLARILKENYGVTETCCRDL